jgi:hypothetical protein
MVYTEIAIACGRAYTLSALDPSSSRRVVVVLASVLNARPALDSHQRQQEGRIGL